MLRSTGGFARAAAVCPALAFVLAIVALTSFGARDAHAQPVPPPNVVAAGTAAGPANPTSLGGAAKPSESPLPSCLDETMRDELGREMKPRGVQARDFIKKHKLELVAHGGLYAGDLTSSTYIYGGSLAWFFTEDFGIEGRFDVLRMKLDLDGPLEGFFGDQPVFRSGRAYLGLANLVWSPIHAKMKMGDGIVHADILVTAGAGRLDHDSVQGVTYDAGLSLDLFMTHWVTFRFDARDVMAVQEAVAETRFTHNLVATAGLAFWIPLAKLALLTIAALFASARAYAEDTSPASKRAVARTDATTTGMCVDQEIADRLAIKRKRRGAVDRLFVKQGRHELSVNGGYYDSDLFSGTYIVGGSYTYHMTDATAVEFAGWYTHANADIIRAVEAMRGQLIEDPYARILVYESLLLWSPVYGKLRLGGEVVHFDIHLDAGVGVVDSQTNRGATGVGGIGMKIFIGKAFAFRLDARDRVFRQELLDEHFLVNDAAFTAGISLFLPPHN